MKDIREFLNLPVISITDGEEVAVDKSVVINCDKRSIEYLMIEKGEKDNQKEVYVIPYTEIVGIGSYAATIESSKSVIRFEIVKFDEKKYKKHDDFISQVIISRTGDFVGTVVGFDFDPKTGSIGTVTYKNDLSKIRKVNIQDFITIGQKFLIMSSKTDNNIEDINIPSNSKSFSSGLNSGNFNVESFIKDKENNIIGKVLEHNLLDFDGNVIVQEGTEITKKILDKVRSVDENLLFEMFASV